MADNIPISKIVTFVDLQEMIDGGDFLPRNPFDGTSTKLCTKSECNDALMLDLSGSIGPMPANRLIARMHLVPAIPTLKDVMRTDPGDNNENQNSKGTVSINIKHNGPYELPWIGDQIYNEDGSIFTSYGGQNFFGCQRYPAPGVNDEVNMRLGESPNTGIVEWIGWVSDNNQKPSFLTAVNINYYEFRLDWNGGGQYTDLRYKIEHRQRNPDGNWTVVGTYTNAELGNGVDFSWQFNNVGDSEVRVTSIASGNTGQSYKYDKVSDILFVDVKKAVGIMLGDAGSGQPCDIIPPSYTEVWFIEGTNEPQVGDYAYETRFIHESGPFNGSGKWWRTSGDTRSYRIGSDGLIEGVATC